MTAPILALRGVNKSFGPIDVLHDITLEVRPGEVLCLLGDNGAGKSTLIKIMSGVHQPSSGVIELDGEPVPLPTPGRQRMPGSRPCTSSAGRSR
jgi:simple sugar transport system ATP-binding protein